MSATEHEANTAAEELESLLAGRIDGARLARAIDRLIKARIAEALATKP
jgi:hypothetical protein